MLSVQAPENRKPYSLKRVLFGSEVYLIPRRNGRILIGATSEDVGWMPHNTPAGIHTLLTQAIRLYPDYRTGRYKSAGGGFVPQHPMNYRFSAPVPVKISPWRPVTTAMAFF
jgi:thiazole synthase